MPDDAPHAAGTPEPPRHWTADELRALAADAFITARDRQARRMPIPAALALTEALPAEQRWADDVAKLHASSRVDAAGLWWEAMRRPAVPRSTAVLAEYEGAWHEARLTYVNLLEQPDVAAMIVLLDIGEPAAEVPAVAVVPDTGYEAPTWALLELDSVGRIIRADGMVADLYGCSAEEITERSILDSMHPEDTGAALAMWLDLMDNPESTRTLRSRTLHPDGRVIWVEATVLRRGDAEDEAVMVIAHDVSDRRARETALRERADRDALTGLMNRRAVEDRLAELLAADGPGAVVAFVDLDGFKAINDEADHDAGDRALAELGRRFEELAGPHDVVGRWGGDEFVILATDLATAGTRVPELLGRALSDPIPLREGAWQPAASLGLATARPGDDPGDAVRRADQAMYLDKQSRRAAK